MPTMHPNELNIDTFLVRGLLQAQFPQWAGLPLKKFPSAGTENAIYRLGAEMCVRLPRTAGAEEQIIKEHRWLPLLAPHLPLAVPVPAALGRPTEVYPSYWSICPWLEGQNVTLDNLTDLDQAARDLAQFISALRRIDVTDGPPPGAHNFYRGEPLARRDADTRAAIAELDFVLDAHGVTAVWEDALRAPTWQGAPTWIHGDMLPGNLLADGGRITAVIDFGGLGVGDPACDLMVAWTLFTADARAEFRSALTVDDATWARGRGWALSFGLIALPYYQESNPILAAIARQAIDEALIDFQYEK